MHRMKENILPVLIFKKSDKMKFMLVYFIKWKLRFFMPFLLLRISSYWKTFLVYHGNQYFSNKAVKNHQMMMNDSRPKITLSSIVPIICLWSLKDFHDASYGCHWICLEKILLMILDWCKRYLSRAIKWHINYDIVYCLLQRVIKPHFFANENLKENELKFLHYWALKFWKYIRDTLSYTTKLFHNFLFLLCLYIYLD